MWSHHIKFQRVFRECIISVRVMQDMNFRKYILEDWQKKYIAKTWYIINYNYQLPHHFIQFSFWSCQEQKELHSVKALRQENGEYYFVFKQFAFQGTWADPSRTKMMVNHIPFMHSYFGLGFFPKLAHNLSFPWTTLVSKHFSGFYPQLYFSFSFSFSFFFFQVLGANIFQGGFDSSLLSFLCSSLPLYTNKSGSCLEPDDTLWLSQTSACFLQGGPCFGSEKSIPRQYLAALASLILLLYRSYSCIS